MSWSLNHENYDITPVNVEFHSHYEHYEIPLGHVLVCYLLWALRVASQARIYSYDTKISTRIPRYNYFKDSRCMTPTQIVITTTRCNYPFYLESEPLLDYQSHFSYPLGVKHIFQGFLVKTFSTFSLMEDVLKNPFMLKWIYHFNYSS